MATVIVPDVDDEAVRILRTEAEAQGGTLESAVRAMIEGRKAARPHEHQAEVTAVIDDLRAYAVDMHEKYGFIGDTTEWIRQDRQLW